MDSITQSETEVPTKSPVSVIIITALISALIVGAAVYFIERNQQNSKEASLQAQVDSLKSQLSNSPQTTSTPTPTTSTTATPTASATATTSPASTVYRTQYFTLNIPSGWTATGVSGNQAAVNVTKGKYILYVNTNFSQASPVNGGRFAEIAQGSPSADAVIKSWPGDPCLAPVMTSTGNISFQGTVLANKRADLYVDGSTASAQNCNVPAGGASTWYFSYLTSDKGNNNTGYINDYTATANPGLVVTMSYQAGSVNDLPKQHDADLDAALAEMTSIAQSLNILQK